MDRPSTHRGMRLGTCTSIHHSRSGWGLWRPIDQASSCDGHPGSADRTAITMSKCTYGEAYGSIRRGSLDHVAVFGEQHLRRLLGSYQSYYSATRTHLSLNKDAPVPRAGSSGWPHRGRPAPQRSAPSIRPDLICGRDSGYKLISSAGALVAFADHVVALLQERGHPWRLSDEAKPGGWTT